MHTVINFNDSKLNAFEKQLQLQHVHPFAHLSVRPIVPLPFFSGRSEGFFLATLPARRRRRRAIAAE